MAEREELFGRRLVRKLLLPLVLAILSYSILLLYGDARAVGRSLARLPPGILIFGLLVSLVSFGFRFVRFRHYLSASGIKVPARVSFHVFLAGLGMSITPGKVGELLKSLLLKEACDIPIARSAPIVVAERVMDLGALVTLGITGLVYRKSPPWALTVGVLALVFFFVAGKSHRLALVVVNSITKIQRLARYRDKLLTAHSALFDLWSLGSYTIAMLLSLVAWLLQALIIVLFGAALPEAAVNVPGALVAYSAPLLAGTLALLPGGLGLTEASMTGALEALSGVSPVAATTLTILIRVVTFWLAVLIGFGALVAWRPQLREQVEPSASE